MIEDLGWGGDHIDKLLRLQKAVAVLAQASGKTHERLQRATGMLVGLFPRDFPKHLLRRAENVLALRQKYVFHAGGDSYFFPVPTSEKRRFVEDLVALYEACLIDAGRLDKETREIIYPQDAPNEPAKRRRRSKTR